METLEMIYLYVVLMDYAKSFWAAHYGKVVQVTGACKLSFQLSKGAVITRGNFSIQLGT